MSQTKKNIFFNLLLTFSNIFFPFITFPYISRVLGPEYLGRINFASAFMDYFIILGNIGISLYGIREIAACNNDKEKLNKTFSEIFTINNIATLIATVLYIILVFSLEDLRDDWLLFLLLGLSLYSNPLGVAWFFTGIENFRVVSIRTIVIRIISLIAMFIFVKNYNDYIIYAAIIGGGTFTGNLVQFIYSRKFVKYSLKGINIFLHKKGVLYCLLISVSTRMYEGMDKVMTGFISGDVYVGYYSASDKLINLILSLILSITAVLFPKISQFFKSNNEEQFLGIVKKSLQGNLLLSIPAMFGIIAMGEPIINLFASSRFEGSILTLQILSMSLFIGSISNVIGVSLLYVTGKEKKYILSILISGVMGIVFNILLIPNYQQNGAAVGTIFANLTGVIFQSIFSWYYIRRCFPVKALLKYFCISVVMFVLILILKNSILINLGELLSTIVIISAAVLFYSICLNLVKDTIFLSIKKDLYNRFKNRRNIYK